MNETCTRCIACQKEYASDAMHYASDMHICMTCFERKTIEPGQYLYALRLWFWKNFQKRPTDPLPQFWPQYSSGKPLSIADILTIAVRYDIDRFPCGKRCSCDYVINKKHSPITPLNAECVFYRMNNLGHTHKTALLLYWWHTLYRNKKVNDLTPPLSEFWPFADGKPLHPKDMVSQVLH